MSKRAAAVVEEQDMKTGKGTLASQEAMAKRRVLGGHIRDRMAKPATAVEYELRRKLLLGHHPRP